MIIPIKFIKNPGFGKLAFPFDPVVFSVIKGHFMLKNKER